MHSSAKLLGVIIFGVAVTFCLTLCSFPEILTLAKTNAGQCHTEEDQESDSAEYCCSGLAILPIVPSHYFPAVMHDWTHQVITRAYANIFHLESAYTWYPLIFDSPRVTVLRI
jgi:hypothetical protein